MITDDKDDVLDALDLPKLASLSDYQLIGCLEQDHHFTRENRTVFQQEIARRGLAKDQVESLKKQYHSDNRVGGEKYSKSGWLLLIVALLLAGLLLISVQAIAAYIIMTLSVLFAWKAQGSDKPTNYYWQKLRVVILLLLVLLLAGVGGYEYYLA